MIHPAGHSAADRLPVSRSRPIGPSLGGAGGQFVAVVRPCFAPAGSPAQAGWLTMLAGLAFVEAIEATTGVTAGAEVAQ